MSLTKRNRYYHYDFIYKGVRHQGSTNQTNINKARLVEAKIRSDVALEHFGVGPQKQSPMFKDFMENRFLPHVRQHCVKRRTRLFYEEKTRRLLEYAPFAEMRMSDIDEEAAAKFALWRARAPSVTSKAEDIGGRRAVQMSLPQMTTVAIATINGELRTLRRAVLLAYEWRLIQRRPRIRTLPGEHQREFVLTRELEAAYLSIATYPLKQAAILMLDLGLRPEECVSLGKSDILNECAAVAHRTEAIVHGPSVPAHAHFNSLRVRSGKTRNAVRSLPLTERSAEVIAFLFDLWPESEWLFPGKKGKHLTRGALDNAHAAIRRHIRQTATVQTLTVEPVTSKRMAAQETFFPPDFVLYTFRHTFGTRLAESGASPFDIAKIMGHSSVVTSQRYIHIGSESVSRAMAQKELFDRHMSGDHEETATVERRN